MRTFFALVLALAACGGSGGTVTAPHDMATKGDLSGSRDFTVPGIGCDAYVACLNSCPDTGPAHDSCFTACKGQVGSTGLQRFNDILICAQMACGAAPDTTPDMGSPCRYDPSNNQFDDPTACGSCQSQQLTMGTCASQQSACAADKAGE